MIACCASRQKQIKGIEACEHMSRKTDDFLYDYDTSVTWKQVLDHKITMFEKLLTILFLHSTFYLFYINICMEYIWYGKEAKNQ